MVTTNKKLIKEIKTLIESSTKAMNLAKSEVDKIDAKYKALAEKEKAELKGTIKFFEEQVSKYTAMVKEESETQEEEAEEAVTDTIFPENNETGEEETTSVAVEPLEAPAETIEFPETAEEQSAETPTEITAESVEENVEAVAGFPADEGEWEVSSETPGVDAPVDEDEEWPAMPEEWK